MNKQLKFNFSLKKIINNSLINLPTPRNISIWWNFGSLLGLCLIIQIITGLFLTIYYSANTQIAFDSVIYISRNVNYGWLIQNIHSNNASLLFICLYTHVGRGIYYNSYMLIKPWIIGVLLLFLIIATAFIGYVLPWGQISFWGATVITNLLSTIPLLGINLVQWIWGGFSIDNATLTRFFSFHFLLPFIITAFIIIHLLALHQTGSNNPLGLNNHINKIPFNHYFIFKDIIGFNILLLLLLIITLINPYFLRDPDNFTPANPLNTPPHIQPEWYFLFAYAILRSIPNKLGGVIALVISISILLILPFYNLNKFQGNQFYPSNKIIYWTIIITIILLTWIGINPVEIPYILTGQWLTLIYFLYYYINPIIYKLWDNILINL